VGRLITIPNINIITGKHLQYSAIS